MHTYFEKILVFVGEVFSSHYQNIYKIWVNDINLVLITPSFES